MYLICMRSNYGCHIEQCRRDGMGMRAQYLGTLLSCTSLPLWEGVPTWPGASCKEFSRLAPRTSLQMATISRRTPTANRIPDRAACAIGGTEVASFIRPVIASGRLSKPWKRGYRYPQSQQVYRNAWDAFSIFTQDTLYLQLGAN